MNAHWLLSTFLVLASSPALAFNCSLDPGMKALSKGHYAAAQAQWELENAPWNARAAARLLSEWGDLARWEADRVIAATRSSEREIARFIDALTACDSSTSRGAKLLTATAYFVGLGKKQDRSKAEKIFRRAARDGDALSNVALAAIAQQRGETAEYRSYLASARESGNVDSFMIGQMLFRGCIFRRDLPEAARWFESGANDGDAKSQRALAYMLFLGAGIAKDEMRAEALLGAADAADPQVNQNEQQIILEVAPGPRNQF